jgi:hypothetical protein
MLEKLKSWAYYQYASFSSVSNIETKAGNGEQGAKKREKQRAERAYVMFIADRTHKKLRRGPQWSNCEKVNRGVPEVCLERFAVPTHPVKGGG